MRYLLENFPRAEIPSCGNNGTQKWQYIWTKAWNNAELASGKGDRTHPLYEPIPQPKLLGKGIYGMWTPIVQHVEHEHPYILRRERRHLETTPLDKDQKHILKAVTPRDGFNENTDQNTERMKLGIKLSPKRKVCSYDAWSCMAPAYIPGSKGSAQPSDSYPTGSIVEAKLGSDKNDNDSIAPPRTSAVSRRTRKRSRWKGKNTNFGTRGTLVARAKRLCLVW